MAANEMHWATSFVFVCLIATQAQCDKGQDGFVIRSQMNESLASCISNPINDTCLVDYKVANGTQNPLFINKTAINNALDALLSQIRGNGGTSENCTKAVKMFRCSQLLYTCEHDYVYLDSNKTYALCMTAKEKCTGLDGMAKASLLDCESAKNVSVKRFKRREACMKFPNVENNTCPMQNFKIPPRTNISGVDETYRKAQKMFKDNNVSANCSNAALGAICDIGFPACTRNEEYIVSFLTIQKCHEIMRCLNATNNTKLTNYARELCGELPDEGTAKKIPRGDIEYQGTMQSTTIYMKATKTQHVVVTTTTSTQTTTKKPCCGTSKSSSITHILMVFMAGVVLATLA